MAKAKKAVVIEKKHKVQKAPKIKVVPKVQKIVAEVKKVQPKNVQPKVKKVESKDENVKPKPEIKQSLDVPIFLPLIPSKSTDAIIKNIPVEVKVKDEQQLNVSEMTIKEIMIQKGLSYEGAISFLKDNQRK